MNKNALERSLLTEDLYNLLKEQILSMKFQAGEKINVDKLAREYDVSKIPVREVLTRLVAEGFVRIVPYKGMFVAEMSPRDIDEIFQIRIQLEILALENAIDIIPLKSLTQLQEEIDTNYEAYCTEVRESGSFIRKMNEGLHGMILRYSGNRNLENLIRSYIDHVHRYLALTGYESNVSADLLEHKAIIDQIIAKNKAGARESLKHHLEQSRLRIRSKMK